MKKILVGRARRGVEGGGERMAPRLGVIGELTKERN